MARRNRLAVLVLSLKLLRRLGGLRYGLTIEEMQGDLGGVSKRTVRRYLKAFKAAGVLLEGYTTSVSRCKKWRISRIRNGKASIFTQTA